MSIPSTTVDLSGNGNTGYYTPNGGLLTSASGPFGDTGNSLLILGDNSTPPPVTVYNQSGVFDVTDFTVEAIVNIGYTGTTRVFQILDVNSAGDLRFNIGIQVNSSLATLYIANALGSTFTIAGSFNANTWHHVAVSYAGGTWQGYIDGVAQTATTGFAINTGLTNQPLTIGGQQNGAGEWTGYLAAAAFFTPGVAGGRIAQHSSAVAVSSASYEAAVLADSPLGFWMLGAGTASATKNAQWTVGEIAMSDFSAPNVTNMSASSRLSPFYQSNYGVLVIYDDGTATTTRPPGSTLLLYRVDPSTSSPTGYTITWLPQSLVSGFCDHVHITSNVWSSLIQSFMPLNDTTIIALESRNTGFSYNLRTLVRNADGTMTFSGPQQIHTNATDAGGLPGGGGLVRTGNDTFAWKWFDGTNYWVDGLQVIGNTIYQISHSNAALPDTNHLAYHIYTYQNGYMIGWTANTSGSDNSCFAAPWGPGSGYTGSINISTLSVFPNVGPRTGLDPGDGTMLWGNASGTYSSYFDGASWTHSSTAKNTDFPFSGPTNGILIYPWFVASGPDGQLGNLGDFLTIGKFGTGTTSFHLEYARNAGVTGQTPLLAQGRITGLDYNDMLITSSRHVNQVTGNGIVAFARHSESLSAMIITVGDSNLVAVSQMYAFATP